ncbi:hypothetical protein CERSUDRAFT_116624 [Gelatoporia subvermispora B]|uniref:Uncharacterized protein n=1 Tax=Ceriporiopsis subvermispora (strain B) TaxID=914234 RepID=M2R8U0_CERS8|nr:hypothetical protein CERSUDRAFT_116624 [Gelatoporia subvermispora B]
MGDTIVGLCALLATLYIPTAFSAPSNITIDDLYGDPVTGAQFNYTGSWNEGQQCGGCFARPDPGQMYEETWHDATRDNGPVMSASVMFPGTALWVYGALAHAGTDTPGFTTTVNLTFLIDGETSGSFMADPPASGEPDSTYDYDVVLFQQHSLSDGQHNFTLLNEMNSLVILDRLVYVPISTASSSSQTMQTSSTPSSSSISSSSSASTSTRSNVGSSGLSSQTTTIIAVVTSVGCALIIAIVGATCYWRKRHWRRSAVRSFISSSSVDSLHDNEIVYPTAFPPPAYDAITPASSSEACAVVKLKETHRPNNGSSAHSQSPTAVYTSL